MTPPAYALQQRREASPIVGSRVWNRANTRKGHRSTANLVTLLRLFCRIRAHVLLWVTLPVLIRRQTIPPYACKSRQTAACADCSGGNADAYTSDRQKNIRYRTGRTIKTIGAGEEEYRCKRQCAYPLQNYRSPPPPAHDRCDRVCSADACGCFGCRRPVFADFPARIGGRVPAVFVGQVGQVRQVRLGQSLCPSRPRARQRNPPTPRRKALHFPVRVRVSVHVAHAPDSPDQAEVTCRAGRGRSRRPTRRRDLR